MSKTRELRRNLTDAEHTLWKHLRLRQVGGHKFRRQQPIGKYIVDFVCFERRLIIELDGGQHAAQVSYDMRRSEWLKSQGYRILRFWDNEVLEETESVKEVIMEVLGSESDTPPPLSSPQGGRR